MTGEKFQPTTKVGEWTDVNKTTLLRLVSFDDLAWELGTIITSHHVAVCGFGGPIAICSKDPSQGKEIALYNSIGFSMGSAASIYLGDGEELLYMTWSDVKDHIIIVLKDGSVRFLNTKGESVAMSQHVQNPLMCCATGNGVAIVLESNRAVALECEDSGEYRPRIAELPRSMGAPAAMMAIPSQLSDTGYCQLYITPSLNDLTEESTVVCVTFHSSKPRAQDLQKRFAGGSIRRMSMSPDASHVAIISEDGSVYICDSEFSNEELLFNTETDVLPTQLVWCGPNAVTYLHLSRQFSADDEVPTTLTIFDPFDRNNSCSMELASDVLLIQECDGIRVLSEDTYQFLQVVPEEARRIFQTGSTALSSLLKCAFDEYMSESAASVRIIRQLTEDVEGLPGAIDDCVVAAGFEFDTEQQQRLLRIASFGKSFCPTYDTDSFVNMARRLRVMFAVRKPLVGLAISMQQLITLEGERLVQRLIEGSHFQLAYCICDLLSLKADKVMSSWAAAKLSSSEDDSKIAAAITSKFKTCPGISFKEVAQLAHAMKKTRLAKILLESEVSSSTQVEALLDIKEVDSALKKAIDSSDPDLIFYVVAHLIGNRGASTVPQLMSDPVSCNMLLSFCLACESRRDLLTDYYRENPEYNTFLAVRQHLGEHDRLTKHLLKSSSGWEQFQSRKAASIQSAELLAKKEPQGQLKERLLRLQSDLIDEQTKFVKETNDTKFLNSSVSETLRLLWIHNKGDRADAMAKRWNVNERMLCWIKLRALAQINDWPGIDKLAGKGTKNKPAIGLAPFIRTLAANGRQDQAKEYIPKVPTIEERMELYLLCDDWAGAAVDCKRNNEQGIIEQLRSRANGNQRHIEQLEKGLAMKVETSAFANLFR
jgi:vacuolar protein sorting-associated protein 16